MAQDGSAARSALADGWATAVAETQGPPRRELSQQLKELLDAIVGDLVSGRPCAAAAQHAGAVLAAQTPRPDGLPRSLKILGTRLPLLPELTNVAGLPTKVMSVLGDVAGGYADAVQRRAAEEQEDIRQTLQQVLQRSDERFREVFAESAVGIAISDLDGSLVQTNRALAEILGYTEAELAHRNLYDLVGGRAGERLRLAYRDVAAGRLERFRVERPLQRKDGDEAWVFLAVSVLRDERGAATHHVTMVEDITDLHLLQEQLNNQALHDVLTGLPNRQSFALRLESTLGQLDPKATITLLHLDIDGFAVINDGLGHRVGDQLLRVVAQRLQALLADERAVIGRIAGDEFAVLLENSPTTPPVATLTAQINHELSEPVYLAEHGLGVSACIGVVQRPAGGIRPAELLRQADATLRRAKANGKRQWALYDPYQDERDCDRFTLAADMPGALETGEFQPVYRPLVRLADGAVVAVEALVCWQHPRRGTIGHHQCLELADETGMVLPLGEWLLAAAIGQAKVWHDEFGERAPLLVVNLAESQAQDPDLVGLVHGLLDAGSLEAERLQLALPVGALLAGISESTGGDAEDNLQVLADLGVRTAMHDFGGEHGSLVVLEDLPVRAVQVAPWLVRRLAQRPESVAGRALGQLVPLVHACGASVITPEVHTEEQARWWRAMGADVACGDQFGSAQPPEAITELLRSASAAPGGW